MYVCMNDLTASFSFICLELIVQMLCNKLTNEKNEMEGFNKCRKNPTPRRQNNGTN